jgi:hypothetical protein
MQRLESVESGYDRMSLRDGLKILPDSRCPSVSEKNVSMERQRHSAPLIEYDRIRYVQWME